MCKIRGQGREDFEGEGAKIGTLHRASTERCRGRDSRARRCTAEPNRAALKRKQSPELSLRGAKRRGNLGKAVAFSPIAAPLSNRVLRDCHGREAPSQ